MDTRIDHACTSSSHATLKESRKGEGKEKAIRRKKKKKGEKPCKACTVAGLIIHFGTTIRDALSDQRRGGER